MNKIQELDARRKAALDKMKEALNLINGTRDMQKKAEYNVLLNESFSELKNIAEERILFVGGFLK